MYKISLVRGDILDVPADAIVCPVNAMILDSSEVALAIFEAAGVGFRELVGSKIIQSEKSAERGDALSVNIAGTKFKLEHAKHVIITFAPGYVGGTDKEDEKLALCYENSIKLTQLLNVKKIAFPAIATGILQYPKREAAEIAVRTIRECCNGKVGIEEVILAVVDNENFQIYKEVLSEVM